MRHHSEESLSGVGSSMRGEIYSTRVHSSADDLSSANRSERSDTDDETDSSSDESFTKTEAEVDSPSSSPHFRLPALLPVSLDIEKAWSRMNAEFTAHGHRPPAENSLALAAAVAAGVGVANSSTNSNPRSNSALNESIELKGSLILFVFTVKLI